jgi:hypothetical protein
MTKKDYVAIAAAFVEAHRRNRGIEDADEVLFRTATVFAGIKRRASSRAIMTRAKRVAGYSNVPGTTTDLGDMIEFRPRGICRVMFITFGE